MLIYVLDYLNMASSNHLLDQYISKFIAKYYDPVDTVLDVGAGSGKYRILFDRPIDGIEIYEPYVEKFKLREKYNKIIIGDILTTDVSAYNIIVFGDILEHIEITKAIKLIADLNAANKKLLVVLPYKWIQDKTHPFVIENRYEEHLQPDLTPEIVKERYPCLHAITIINMNKNPFIGLYANAEWFK